MAELADLQGQRGSSNYWRDILVNPSLIVGALIVLLLLFIVLFGPELAPHNPYLIDRVVATGYDFDLEEYIRNPLSPSEDFILGTDGSGMDLFSLLLYGARNTLMLAFLIAVARLMVGLVIGLLAGWFEGSLFDRAVVGAISVLGSLPILISGMIVILALGLRGGMWTFLIALTGVGWSEAAQYIRGEVLVARKLPYIEGARSLGQRESLIAIRHVVPNIMPQLLVLAFLEISAVLILIGELALFRIFVGGGIFREGLVTLPSRPDWGAMVASGFRYLRPDPHVVYVPAAAIFFAVVGFNALGEGLRIFFQKRGVNAAVLFSSRALVALAIMVVGVGVVFRVTEPSPYFGEMADDFSQPQAEDHARLIAGLAQGSSDAEFLPQAEYMGQQLEAFDVYGGIRWSEYVSERSELLYSLEGTPQLAVFGPAGEWARGFVYEEDFGYIMDGYGGRGTVNAPLVFLRFPQDLNSQNLNLPSRLGVAGRIVVLEEGNALQEIAPLVVEQGASGIIWLMQEGSPLQNARLEPLGGEGGETARKVPAFRMTAEAMENMLASADMHLAELLPEQTEEGVQGAGTLPELIETDIDVHMQIELDEGVEIEISNIVAYHQGLDIGIGTEIIILVAPCDGLWQLNGQSPAFDMSECASPALLDFARVIYENPIDLRRPLAFVFWGGGEFSYSDLSEWLNDSDNFAHFSAPGRFLQPRPYFVIQVTENEKDAADLVLLDGSSDGLREIFEDAVVQMDATYRYDQDRRAFPLWIPQDASGHTASVEINSVNLDSEAETRGGEALAYSIIRLIRETILSTF